MTDEAVDTETALREESGQAEDEPLGAAMEATAAATPEAGPADATEAEALAALRQEWGTEFEANLALAQEAAGAIADEGLVALLEETGLGDDPRIVRAAARIGRLLRSEDRARNAEPAGADREALEAALDELSSHPNYWSEAVQRRVRAIHLSLHGDGSIPVHRAVGDGGNG